MKDLIRKEEDLNPVKVFELTQTLIDLLVERPYNLDFSKALTDLQFKAFFTNYPQIKEIEFGKREYFYTFEFIGKELAIDFIRKEMPDKEQEIIDSINDWHEKEYECLEDVSLEELEGDITEIINNDLTEGYMGLLHIPSQQAFSKYTYDKLTTRDIIKHLFKQQEGAFFQLLSLLIELAPSVLETQDYLCLLSELKRVSQQG